MKGEYKVPRISAQLNIIPGTILYNFSSIVGYFVTAVDASPEIRMSLYDSCILEISDLMDSTQNIDKISIA